MVGIMEAHKVDAVASAARDDPSRASPPFVNLCRRGAAVVDRVGDGDHQAKRGDDQRYS